MKKVILADGALVCSIAAMIAALAIHASDSTSNGPTRAGRQPPRSIRERMLEERRSTARGALLSQEPSARADDNGEESAERDAFDKWFYDQRKYPGTTLPLGAVEKANRHEIGRATCRERVK